MMTGNIKECPFCGGRNFQFQVKDWTWGTRTVEAECSNCNYKLVKDTRAIDNKTAMDKFVKWWNGDRQ